MKSKIYKGYCVYESGQIYNEEKSRFLKPGRGINHNYNLVTLNKVDKEVVYVHNAVWMAFYGPIPASHKVYHLDGNQTNNHLGNLAIVEIIPGLGQGSGQVKPIICFNLQTEETTKFNSLTTASKKLGIPIVSISNNLRQYTKICKKIYKFSYDKNTK